MQNPGSASQKWLIFLLIWGSLGYGLTARAQAPHHYLYVACPGIRNYLQYGGHGLLVFDMDHEFRFVRRIHSGGLDSLGQPMNVKGIGVSQSNHYLYISTLQTLICIDLLTDKQVWERTYEGGCDRFSVSPDGRTIYLPTLEGDDWKEVDAANGNVLRRIPLYSRSHNTLYGRDGSRVYLEGLGSNYLTVLNAATAQIEKKVGPFSNHVRPFTVDAKEDRCFVNVDSLLGFEIGDLHTGRKTDHVEVKGFHEGPVKRHGCPSHGISLSPDEKEIWLSDGFNEAVHVFELRKNEIRQTSTIRLSDQPGWITFSVDGKYVLPSTGDIIDAHTKKILYGLKDETGARVQSEKMIEIQFTGKELTGAGDQFGIGRASQSSK